MNENQLIRELPKVELHCHLDGSVRPETVLEMAKLEKIQIPSQEIDEFKKCVQVLGHCESLKEYLEKFNLILQTMQKKEYLYRHTLEVLEDASKHNVKYIELRFSPFFLMEGGMSFEEVMESILSAMDEAKKRFKILSNLILCCMRHEGVERSLEVVERGRKYLGKGVVAVDLAGNEQDFPPELHEAAFKKAKEYGYHITIHAGETGIAENIVKSVEILGAERIGHGIYAYKNQDVYDFVKERKLPLEMCITSNVHTGASKSYEAHPIKRYLDDGLVVTVNTDNTTVSNTDLDREFGILFDKQGFKYEDAKKVILNSLEVSFASNEDKEELRKVFEEEFTGIEAAIKKV